MHLQRRAIVRQKVGFLHFLLFQSKNYKYGTTSRVSKQAMLSLVDDILDLNATENQCIYTSVQNIHLSSACRVFEIKIANYLDTVHPSNFCKPCHIVVHTYMKALNEGKVYKYSTVMFSCGWGPHLEDRCSTCEHVKSLQLGGKAKEESWIWKTINQRYKHCYQPPGVYCTLSTCSIHFYYAHSIG